MVWVGLMGTLVGLFVGRRSAVYGLIPVMAGVLIAAVLVAILGSRVQMGAIAIQVGLFLTGLQMGYLAGAVLRLSIARGAGDEYGNRRSVPTAHVS